MRGPGTCNFKNCEHEEPGLFLETPATDLLAAVVCCSRSSAQSIRSGRAYPAPKSAKCTLVDDGGPRVEVSVLQHFYIGFPGWILNVFDVVRVFDVARRTSKVF